MGISGLCLRLAIVAAAGFHALVVASRQDVFDYDGSRFSRLSGTPNTIDGQNFTTMHLSSVQSLLDFTTLAHPMFPNHQVRIKRSNFCDPTVNVYTGYLDVDYGAKHLFFYFFESRRNPDKDDVMMWINGGPGCSSAMGLLMELGPCNIDMTNTSSNGTVWNPYGWNNEANIFFLDQPVNVGYSYADYGETVESTLDAAKNVHAFLTIFFETFPQFEGRSLHLSGESYAGQYLPVFASEVVDQNIIARAEGRPILNLTSVLIGNGLTDLLYWYRGSYEVECSTASLDVPFQSISRCVRMKAALPRCEHLIKKSCITSFDAMDCQAATAFCDHEINRAYYVESGRNPYDLSKKCENESSLCYSEVPVIETFLNQDSIRDLIGADGPYNFSSCNNALNAKFWANNDLTNKQAPLYVAALMERGIRVLIYAGTYDRSCNWIANKLWIEALEWSGKDAFGDAEWRDWYLPQQATEGGEAEGNDNAPAGITKTGGLMTFATILGAGHMMSLFHSIVPIIILTFVAFARFYVPHDKPAEAFAMISRWIAGHPL